MKKLLVLPGNSISNRDWVKGVEEKFSTNFKVISHSYVHWDRDESLMDLKEEESRILIPDCDYVFAKSAGIMLALHAIKNNIIKPQVCFFVGVPKPWADKHGYDLDSLIINHKIFTLFVQQKNDPIFPFDDLEPYLKGEQVKNYNLKSVDGDDHYYGNYQELKEMFLNFSSGLEA